MIPVCRGLVVGFMCRYGANKIRGHGISEAHEATLVGQSRIQPMVAALKAYSPAVAIGICGPFWAEGPIIITERLARRGRHLTYEYTVDPFGSDARQ